MFILALGFVIGRHTDFLAPRGPERDTSNSQIHIAEARDIEPKFSTRPDSAWNKQWKYLSPNIDSLQNEALKYWESIYGDSIRSLKNIAFIATADTSFRDSLISFNVDYVSPIPLHPKSFFRFNDLAVRQKEIHTTETKEVAWYDRFNLGVGIQSRWIDWKLSSNFFGELTYKTINTRYFEVPIRLQVFDNFDGSVEIEARLKL